MTDTGPASMEALRRAFANFDRIAERSPAVAPLGPLSLEERMDSLESHQRLLAGEVLVAQPAMIEGVALILASTLSSAAHIPMLLENAAALGGLPNHGESEWHQNHIDIGRNMAAACILRTATMLEAAAEGAARIAPSSDEVH